MRCASYSRGSTSRRSRSSKFFIARTTWAMLRRSWGSWRTTRTLIRGVVDCGLRIADCPGALGMLEPHKQSAIRSSHELQNAEPTSVLPISPQPDPPVAAAPYELPGAPFPIWQLLVHDQVESRAAPDV